MKSPMFTEFHSAYRIQEGHELMCYSCFRDFDQGLTTTEEQALYVGKVSYF